MLDDLNIILQHFLHIVMLVIKNHMEETMFDKNVKWEADAGNISDYKYFNSFVYKKRLC